MQLDYRFSPDLGELTPKEAQKLGELVEHPSWALFSKYLHIERWRSYNNIFINSKNEIELGYAQGDTGRCNKIEADMNIYHELYLQNRELKTAEQRAKEADRLENDAFAEYDDDEDFPLAP